MTPNDIENMFTRADGDYVFARWGRPIAPIVFGVDDATLEVVKGAVEAVARLARLEVAETDAELGANLLFFFFRDWDELRAVPDLGELVPDLPDLVARLQAADANQYRGFRFDEGGAIKMCFVFLRMDAALAGMAAEDLALSQVVQTVLLWSEAAFGGKSPLAVLPDNDATVLRPEIANLIHAAYDPVMPVAARDKSHALRLFGRMPRE
ncbi:MAG: hypothetical protein Q9M48_08515 [Rhodobacterales bacterium]|nr:hypothetical protein [Rhodobacterales bacterium]